MNEHLFPNDIEISREDFEGCGWREVIANDRQYGYISMWQSLSAAARIASEQQRYEHSKALWLIADACSMVLSPQSLNNPFKPYMEMENRRSAIPEDLTGNDLTFYEQIVDSIDDVWLQARVADLIWLIQRPRNINIVLAAIDAYRQIPIDPTTWRSGVRDCWKRALSVAQSLRAGAGDRVKEMELTVLNALNMATPQDDFFVANIADLLITHGLAKDHSMDIAEKLKQSAIQFDKDGQIYQARCYFDAASDWFNRCREHVKSVEMIVAVAESWVKEAKVRSSGQSPSYMVAASLYEKALQIYKTIPRRFRAIHKGEERIAELHVLMNDAGEKSVDELIRVQTPGEDISELISNARDSVRGKSPQDAMHSFANIFSGAQVAKIRATAQQGLQQGFFSQIFSKTHLSADGRVIAKQPAAGFENEKSADDKSADDKRLWSKMIHDYEILIDLVVAGSICPAHEILLQEHRLTESEFINVAQHTPLVPPNRATLVGKALYAGYDQDFAVALHLLIPQIENIVRFQLKNARVKTTNIDINGIENENGLSTLIELPEVEKIFGKDLTFELKALFCDALGPNLRNELAHGLLDERACRSRTAVYAWWLGLRIVFTTFWNAAHKTTPIKH